MKNKKPVIVRASIIGYCMGVRKAVESAIQARIDYPKSNIFTLGHLIHNPTTQQKLEDLGIYVLEEEDVLHSLHEGDVVIIRAHGTSPQILGLLEEKKVIVIDSTCPHVVSNRHLAQNCAKKGLVVLAGDKNHPELKSIQSYILHSPNTSCIIVENTDEANKIQLINPDSPVFLIAQTTIKKEEFELIKDTLASKITNLQAFNTICSATSKRQLALKELFKKVEAVIIIGGRNSANTKRLLTTCQDNKIPSILVENAEELPENFFSFQRIGLASGASTPDEVIDCVEKKLKTEIL